MRIAIRIHVYICDKMLRSMNFPGFENRWICSAFPGVSESQSATDGIPTIPASTVRIIRGE